MDPSNLFFRYICVTAEMIPKKPTVPLLILVLTTI